MAFSVIVLGTDPLCIAVCIYIHLLFVDVKRGIKNAQMEITSTVVMWNEINKKGHQQTRPSNIFPIYRDSWLSQNNEQAKKFSSAYGYIPPVPQNVRLSLSFLLCYIHAMHAHAIRVCKEFILSRYLQFCESVL